MAYLNSHRVREEIPPSPGTDSTGSVPDTGSFLQSTFCIRCDQAHKSPLPLFEAAAKLLRQPNSKRNSFRVALPDPGILIMRTHLKRPASSMLRVNSETHASVLREANNCLLVLDKVTKDYVTDGAPVRALHDVSLEVATGQFLALVGRSGCGKSTLLNLAGAMDFPTSGQVLVDGISTNSLSDAGLTQLRRQKVGFIFQSFQLLHTLTVLENVELPLLLAGVADARPSARQRLEWVELADLADRYPHQLSGGQMQRVAIARALVHSPRLVLADEPTGNLDTTTGAVIVELLQRVVREQKVTVLMATHSVEAAALADIVVRMRDGHIEELVQS